MSIFRRKSIYEEYLTVVRIVYLKFEGIFNSSAGGNYVYSKPDLQNNTSFSHIPEKRLCVV